MVREDIKDFKAFEPFDRYVGEKRHMIKDFDRTVNYRDIEIKRNRYIPNGAHGRWEVPSLIHFHLGGKKVGLLSVSKTQCMEAIDKWYHLNNNN